MGSCFSKKANTTALTPAPQISDLKSNHPPPTNDHQPFKKEIFVIKHRISHEIDRHSDLESDKNPSPTATAGAGDRLRTPSCSKEELDSILIQCDRLSRNNSAGAQNPNFRRRRSRSERSFDSACNSNANANNHHEDAVDADIDADYTDDALDHRHRNRQAEIRVSSSIRSNSKERRISISPSRRSNSKERRISISPSRRSQSPFSNKNPNPVAAGGASGSSSSNHRPAKMVSVPATDKSNNAGVQQPVAAGPVKRIHVKRNVSPARTNIRVFSDDHSQDQESSSSTREADYRRKSLVEIDNNAGRSATTQPRDTKRTRRLSRDLDINPEPVFGTSPSPPSYASLLLEDIQNFHKKNTANAAATPQSFALPECVNKACLIMEAVADMNSNSSSLCSDDRWRNSKTMKNDSSGMS